MVACFLVETIKLSFLNEYPLSSFVRISRRSATAMATLRDVAKRARVSAGTVSHVLNGTVPVSPDLRQRVEEAIAALDYHPDHVARSLKTGRTRTVAIVIPDISNPFFPTSWNRWIQQISYRDGRALRMAFLSSIPE
jgi:transcriptional regulator with XRE-family HTH domain